MTDRENEMCINREEYTKLIEKIDYLTTKVVELITESAAVKESTGKVEKVVLGNGDPAKGLATRMTLIENVVNVHLAAHEKTNNKLWDLFKPLLGDALRMAITGGILYLVLNPLM